jgi:hypothetical protein
VLQAEAMRGRVRADLVDPGLDQLLHQGLDLVADRADLLDRQPAWIRDVPRFDGRGHVGANVAAAHRDRPVSVQLELTHQLPRLAAREIDADLGHGLHDRRPYLTRR